MKLKDIERTAIRAAEKASKIQTHYLQSGFDIQYKGETNLVTKADIESQEAIVELIQKEFPSHNVLAEEHDVGHDAKLEGPLWIIDPIDGTTNYAHHFPIFSTSIAFVDDHQTMFGLIHLPLLHEQFIVKRSEGAFLNGRSIQVSSMASLSKSVLATGFPYEKKTLKENNLDYFNYFEMNSITVRRPGAATYDLACIASGRFDGYWELSLKPWDIAAGMLLVEEAGGKATDFSGEPIKNLWRGEMLATNGLVHQDMLDAIAKIRLEHKY
ncbi:MAG: inositol monophosphatase [Bdellovibrionales bacterium]|nr:inositol monophosphatase [Bdellovibrionales bacterium]